MNIRSLYHLLRLFRRSTRTAFFTLIGLAFFASACTGLPQPPLAAAVPDTGATATAAPTVSAAMPTAQATTATAGTKAYVGIFKDNVVAVLDTSANKVITTIPVPKGPHGLVVTPDGKWVYVSSDGDSKVSVINTSSDEVVDVIEVGKGPHGLAITPDGEIVLAAVFGANQLVFIDTHTNAVIGQTGVPSPHNIAISPDGQTAYVASQLASAPRLAVFNVYKQNQTGSVALTKVPRALNYSPDGKQIYFTQAGVDAVQVLDPATNQVTSQIKVGASPHHPLFAPNGQTAMVVSQGPGQLSILDAKANKVRLVVNVGKMPHWIAVNAQGTTAWVTDEASNDITVVDLETGSVTATIPVGNAPRKMVILPQPSAAAQNAPANPAGVNVTISGMAFSPASLTVKAGQTITWENMDSIAHTVTSDNAKWEASTLEPGKRFNLTLTQPGVYAYHCDIHPFMKGTITVTQ